MKKLLPVALFALFLIGVPAVQAQTTSFSYQGNLTDGVAAANGTYQMQFAVYDALAAGTQQGSTITNNSVSVVSGLFNVQLDFGATVFAAGANRWLEIRVKKPADAGFTTLSQRQQLTASPYSIRTLSASAADSLSASCVACVTDAHIAQISGSKVTGTAASATNAGSATTAGNITAVLPIANGGTGSTTQNFVDLSNNQTVGGNKTFTGNVAVNGTLNANIGQSIFTAYGTTSTTVTSFPDVVAVPGLSVNVTVPTGYSAFITTTGGVTTTSGNTNGFSIVDITVAVDDVVLTNGGTERVQSANTGGVVPMIRYWKIATTTALSAGAHTITVRAAGTGSGVNASVSSNNVSVAQGTLIVILVKN